MTNILRSGVAAIVMVLNLLLVQGNATPGNRDEILFNWIAQQTGVPDQTREALTLVLTDVIKQLQTGTPNQTFYGGQLWQTIVTQTGNTGVFPQLRNLGDVEEITVTMALPLPQGVVSKMTAQHKKGQSIWEMAISSMTNRIEDASFVVNNSHNTPPPMPKKTPGSDSGSRDDVSTACKMYPNLC